MLISSSKKWHWLMLEQVTISGGREMFFRNVSWPLTAFNFFKSFPDEFQLINMANCLLSTCSVCQQIKWQDFLLKKSRWLCLYIRVCYYWNEVINHAVTTSLAVPWWCSVSCLSTRLSLSRRHFLKVEHSWLIGCNLILSSILQFSIIHFEQFE